MTRTTSARLAGFTFLFYIAVAFPCLVLMDRATRAEGVAGKLTSLAEHATAVQTMVVLTILGAFAALVLAVTLHSLTREVDRELAMLGMACRLGEGVAGVVGLPNTLGLLWLAKGGAAGEATKAVLGTYFLMPSQSAMIGAPFFALGSLAFAWLLWRGRLVPAVLAWLGVIASALLLLLLPLHLAGFVPGTLVDPVWILMLAFEVPLGLWLLFKGVRAPATEITRP